MKIKCSGEAFQEPITHEECLDCALKTEYPPCGYSYPILKALFLGDLNSEKRRDEIHVTDITNCLLRSYLNKVDPAPEYVHTKLNKMIGTAVHSYIEQANKDDPRVTSEIEISDIGIQGRVDLLVGNQLMDIKTTRWLLPRNLPYGDHADQVNIYNALLPDDYDLSIIYLDVSGAPQCKKCHTVMKFIGGVVTCPICGNTDKRKHLGSMRVSIPTDDREEVKARIKERVDLLRNAIETATPPPAEPSWLCGYCSHTQCEHNNSELIDF